MRPIRDEERLRWLERHTDIPLLLLALAMLPLLLTPSFADLSDGVVAWLDIGIWIIWGFFAAALLAKLAVAPNRLAYLRAHPFEVLFVALPLLRPLAFLRVLPLLRVAVILGINVSLLSRFFQQRGITFLAAMLVAVMLIGGTLVWLLERNVTGHDALIETPLDAFWWAFITMTTVGYGDHSPATTGGRIVAAIITVYGIVTFAVIGALAVTLFTQESQRSALAEMREQLARIEERLGASRREPPPGD